jgi:hypothetical protein
MASSCPASAASLNQSLAPAVHHGLGYAMHEQDVEVIGA